MGSALRRMPRTIPEPTMAKRLLLTPDILRDPDTSNFVYTDVTAGGRSSKIPG